MNEGIDNIRGVNASRRADTYCRLPSSFDSAVSMLPHVGHAGEPNEPDMPTRVLASRRRLAFRAMPSIV